jgi:hypothetical protein
MRAHARSRWTAFRLRNSFAKHVPNTSASAPKYVRVDLKQLAAAQPLGTLVMWAECARTLIAGWPGESSDRLRP